MLKVAQTLTFETSRLRLRTVRPCDEEFLAFLDSNAEVMEYIHAGPLSRHVALKWAKAQIEIAPHRPHPHKWIIEFRDHPTRAGWVELSKFHGVFDPNESKTER